MSVTTLDQIQENTQNIKSRLLSFPSLIRAQKSQVEAARVNFKDAQAAVAELEAEMASEISSATNPGTGKPAYSNAEARSAELIKRKAENPEYKAAFGAMRKAEEALSIAQYDLEKLADEFKSYRYVCDLTARELAVVAVEWQAGAGNGEREEAVSVKQTAELF